MVKYNIADKVKHDASSMLLFKDIIISFFKQDKTCLTPLVCRVKIEYVTKNNVFSLKMMMKSGLDKIILKFLHMQATFY